MGDGFLDYIGRQPFAEYSGLKALAEHLVANTLEGSETGEVDEAKLGGAIQSFYQQAVERSAIGLVAGQRGHPLWVELAEGLSAHFKKYQGHFFAGARDIEMASPGAQLSGDLADIYRRSGLVNRAFSAKEPDARELDSFFNALFIELEVLDSVFVLDKKSNNQRTKFEEITQRFDRLAQPRKITVAKGVLDFAIQYFNLDYEKFRLDTTESKPKVFKFADFKLAHFINASVQKGHLTPKMTLTEISAGWSDGSFDFTPQGKLLLDLFNQLFDPGISIGLAFKKIQKFDIKPINARRKPFMVGDGLKGETGARLLASDQSQQFNVVVSDLNLDTIRVSAAVRFLSFLVRNYAKEGLNIKASLKLRQNVFEAHEPLAIISAGNVYMGVAVLGSPQAYAMTILRAIESPASGKAYYVSSDNSDMADIAGVLGAYLASNILGSKIMGIVHPAAEASQSTTPQTLAQWLHHLSKLVIAHSIPMQITMNDEPAYYPTARILAPLPTNDLPAESSAKKPAAGLGRRVLEQMRWGLSQLRASPEVLNVGIQTRPYYFDYADSELGLQTTQMVSALMAGGLGQMLWSLEALPTQLANLSLHQLSFENAAPAHHAELAQKYFIDRKFSGAQRDSKAKKVSGQFLETRLSTSQAGSALANQARARFFWSPGSKGEHTPIEPRPMAPSIHRLTRNLTTLSQELLETYRKLADVPKPTPEALALGVATATQIETYLKQIFSGHHLDRLQLDFHAPLQVGHNYELRLQPRSRANPSFELQVVRPNQNKGSDLIVMNGHFELGIPEAIEAQIGFVGVPARMLGHTPLPFVGPSALPFGVMRPLGVFR